MVTSADYEVILIGGDRRALSAAVTCTSASTTVPPASGARCWRTAAVGMTRDPTAVVPLI
jgi:hypothetical protein